MICDILFGIQNLEANDKYFFEDLGLRNLLAGSDRAGDIEYVVSMDPISKQKDFNGIKHLSLRLFLLSDSL